MERLLTLFRDYAGHKAESVVPVTAAGSGRRYFRIGPDPELIGTIGTDVAENNAFIYFAAKFAEMGLPVPRILGIADRGMAYIQSDAGKTSLYDLIRTGKDSSALEQLLVKTMRSLSRFHNHGTGSIDISRCYPLPQMGRQSVMWDLYYFKYCFALAAGIQVNECALERDFNTLADMIALCGTSSMILRDCQSRNVMVDDGGITFIDFQGARAGNRLYDVASFLWQARAGFSKSMRARLFEEYLAEADCDTATLRARLPLFVLLRSLQVLGAYGLRGLAQRKAMFISSIPKALLTVKELLSGRLFADGAMPELHRALSLLVNGTVLTPPAQESAAEAGLTLHITSFAYKNGIPVDFSGNGGGFVFDCRYLRNPGKFDRYKQLTGLDAPVIDYLEAQGEVQPWLDDIYRMVDRAVEKYIERGFSSLCVSFGCTGGRHRSVYSARHLADHIKERFSAAGVNVCLKHREINV